MPLPPESTPGEGPAASPVAVSRPSAPAATERTRSLRMTLYPSSPPKRHAALESAGAPARREDPQRDGVDRSPPAGRPPRARLRAAAPAPLLPLRLVGDLNERDGAPA